MKRIFLINKFFAVVFIMLIAAGAISAQVDPDTAAVVSVDRFSAGAGHLYIRDSTNNFPAANAPIDFDKEPFISKGYGPEGQPITYYNFDVQPTQPAPIYVLFHEGESTPVAGQLNIIDVIPGEEGYNDFWQVMKVTVPASYVANTITNADSIINGGYQIEETTTIVNCPVVPMGSTAKLRLNGESPELTRGWYDDKVVFYFNFSEKALSTDLQDMVPVSPIFVSFNINPGQEGGGPASGFMIDPANGRTHNVAATLPKDPDYSPLWFVKVYDNADFWNVKDFTTASNAALLVNGAGNVNCPIVYIGKVPGNPETAEEVSVDRFSAEAGHLYVRDSVNNFPGPNMPVDFDKEPFISRGFGPGGEFITYYNFDVQPTEPAPIYVLFREGAQEPVEGQLNIIDVIPGEADYNDFWEVQKVTVPKDYVANTITSKDDIDSAGYSIEETTTLVNCPVVPDESTAKLRLAGESPELTQGWYDGKVVYYFNFSEKALKTDANDMVPVSPIFVSFNINPGQEGGGPGSGFMVDPANGRTHNVAATLPKDPDYSPLWFVKVYDNSDFWNVKDFTTASNANLLVNGAGNVNCPIVEIDTTTTAVDKEESLPTQFALNQNYPNPFNPATTIRFSLPQSSFVTLKVYNSIGQQVAVLLNEQRNPGNYTVNFDASRFASGVYFYRLEAGNFVSIKKMVFLK